MTELNFANDAAIVTSTREDLTVELNSIVTACGQTISIPKHKFLAAGCGVMQSNLDPIVVSNDSVMSVTSFRYLGSLVESHSGVQIEGYLRLPVFLKLLEGLFSVTICYL